MPSEREYIDAALKALTDRGCKNEKEVCILDKDAALAAVLEIADEEIYQEAELESDAMQRKRFLIEQIESYDTTTLGNIYEQHIQNYFFSYVQKAIDELPFDGPSEYEEWKHADDADRLADLRAEQ